MKKWTGVDFDGTLAKQSDFEEFGKPVPRMVERVKYMLSNGETVKILTARASNANQVKEIKKWCKKHIGRELEVTDKKDYLMDKLYDDKARQVIPNTGEVVGENGYGE